MNKNRIISPSILSANFTRIKEDIKKVEDLGIKRLHLDVMDGNFVNNLTFGPFIIEDIRAISKSHFETHLMISNPHKYLNDYIRAGSDTIIIHYEASTDIKRDLNFIRNKGVLSGIAINPKRKDLIKATKNSDLPIKKIEEIKKEVDDLIGAPMDKPKFTDEVVGVVMWVDGTIIDSIFRLDSI